MVGADHLAQVLGIEPRRKRGRADQIAEHHGELAAFGGGLASRGCRSVDGEDETRAGSSAGVASGRNAAIASSSRRRWPIEVTPRSLSSSAVRWAKPRHRRHSRGMPPRIAPRPKLFSHLPTSTGVALRLGDAYGRLSCEHAATVQVRDWPNEEIGGLSFRSNSSAITMAPAVLMIAFPISPAKSADFGSG